MKYMSQLAVIMSVCAVAELVYVLMGLPIPSSVYGLLLMLVLLITRVIKVEQVEGVAGFFLGIMPIMFVPPTVGLIDMGGVLEGQVILLLLIAVVSTFLAIVVTGTIAQGIIHFLRKEDSHE